MEQKCPCFECGGATRTVYLEKSVIRYCEKCKWTGYRVKIPEAIR